MSSASTPANSKVHNPLRKGDTLQPKPLSKPMGLLPFQTQVKCVTWNEA